MKNAVTLKVRNLVKEYGSFKAVSGLTFDAYDQEILGLLGPNGAGKTTTLRMLSGFIPPTQGDIFIAGHSLREKPLACRREIGYLPETVPLYRDMTVAEFLDFIGGLKGLARGDRQSEVNRLIQSLALASYRNQLIGKLSKGFRQRVGLAQAFLGRPKLVLLDEPTSGLDPEQTVEIRNLILRMKENSCVILSTHLLSEVERMADRVLILNEGSIVASGRPRDLNQRLEMGRHYRLGVRGDEEKIRNVLSTIPDIQVGTAEIKSNGISFYPIVTGRDNEVLPRIAEVLVKNNLELLELAEDEVRLEEIFLKLVRDKKEIEI